MRNNNNDNNKNNNTMNVDVVATETSSLLNNNTSSLSLIKEEEGIVKDTTGSTTIDTGSNNTTTNYSISNLQKRLYNYIYPTNYPTELHLLHIDNIVLPINYLLVGVSDGLLRTSTSTTLNVYPIDISNATCTESQQTILNSIATVLVPAAFKLLYGFISDIYIYPIYGYRRKSYMYIGWTLSSFFMIILYCFYNLTLPTKNIGTSTINNSFEEYNNTTSTAFTDLMMTTNTSTTDNKPSILSSRTYILNHNYNCNLQLRIRIQSQQPSIAIIGILTFLYGLGMWIADVMADAVVAQKVRLEPILVQYHGSLQSTFYSLLIFWVNDKCTNIKNFI